MGIKIRAGVELNREERILQGILLLAILVGGPLSYGYVITQMLGGA